MADVDVQMLAASQSAAKAAWEAVKVAREQTAIAWAAVISNVAVLVALALAEWLRSWRVDHERAAVARSAALEGLLTVPELRSLVRTGETGGDYLIIGDAASCVDNGRRALSQVTLATGADAELMTVARRADRCLARVQGRIGAVVGRKWVGLNEILHGEEQELAVLDKAAAALGRRVKPRLVGRPVVVRAKGSA